jgi:hypothetical protein
MPNPYLTPSGNIAPYVAGSPLDPLTIAGQPTPTPAPTPYVSGTPFPTAPNAGFVMPDGSVSVNPPAGYQYPTYNQQGFIVSPSPPPSYSTNPYSTAPGMTLGGTSYQDSIVPFPGGINTPTPFTPVDVTQFGPDPFYQPPSTTASLDITGATDPYGSTIPVYPGDITDPSMGASSTPQSNPVIAYYDANGNPVYFDPSAGATEIPPGGSATNIYGPGMDTMAQYQAMLAADAAAAGQGAPSGPPTGPPIGPPIDPTTGLPMGSPGSLTNPAGPVPMYKTNAQGQTLAYDPTTGGYSIVPPGYIATPSGVVQGPGTMTASNYGPSFSYGPGYTQGSSTFGANPLHGGGNLANVSNTGGGGTGYSLYGATGGGTGGYTPIGIGGPTAGTFGTPEDFGGGRRGGGALPGWRVGPQGYGYYGPTATPAQQKYMAQQHGAVGGKINLLPGDVYGSGGPAPYVGQTTTNSLGQTFVFNGSTWVQASGPGAPPSVTGPAPIIQDVGASRGGAPALLTT